ncbi:MAG TPA: DUF4139 domain-containing protein [Proteobacteria bacterium]|nr:DUF4139 domain-containing protein [Pseudomonadota bacterium]
MDMKVMRFLTGLCAILFAASVAHPAALVSTAKDRRSIGLTIYNNELALVKETRQLKLKKGVFSIRFEDVAQKIDATSVQVKPLGGPGFELLEQNYEFDLITPNKLMDKYVGKRLKLVLPPKKEGDEERVVEAKLISTNNGYVYQIGNEIHLWASGRVILPRLPKDLVSSPTLVWLVKGKGDGVQKLDVSYLTGGFNWRCDYILAVSPDEKSGDFSGWVTITNKSGATYADASVQLIAGEIHRVREYPEDRLFYARAKAAEAGAPQFAEEAFFEYHLYTLKRKTTIKDNQTKQIALLSASGIPLKKRYIVKSWIGMWGADEEKGKVGVYMEFENSKAKKLGMALPKGKVRVYKKDRRGQQQFLGEDTIDHTPVDEKVRLKIGEAFDIVYEGRRTEYRKISRNVRQYKMEYEIRNHKDEAITVEIEVRFYGDWQILEASHRWTKETANRVVFRVPVGAKAKQKVSYKAQVVWW